MGLLGRFHPRGGDVAERVGTRLASLKSLLGRHGYEPADNFNLHPKDSGSLVADPLLRRTR